MLEFKWRTTYLKDAIRDTEIIKLSGVKCTEVKEIKCRDKRGIELTFRGHLHQVLQARRMTACLARIHGYT